MRSSPIQVGSGYYKNLAGGLNATTAIDPYGQTLVAWGENQYGQTGINSLTNLSWTQLSNGDAHSLALRSDKTLWAWGLNSSGQLGTGDTITRQSPTQVSGSWLQIASGASHSVGIKSDNTLYGWGLGTSGQVGDATLISKSSPVQIDTSAWISVDAGTDFSLAIRSDYRLYAWGLGTSGQLGIVLAVSRSTPSIYGSSTASYIQVSAGASHTLAIDNNNKLWAWGFNASGQLGDGTTTTRNGPVSLGASSWTAISAGYSHSAAITSDNRLFTWGDNSAGQLGFNVSTLAIASGQDMSIAVRDDGTLWTWGLNTYGQLGDGTVVSKSIPTAVGLLTTWSKVTRPSYTAYAIKTDGSLWAWGLNSAGSVGDNTTVNRSSPVQIGTSSWTAVNAGGSNVSGVQSAYGITSNSLGYAWGDNTYGQLGTGTNSIALSPIQISAISSWNMISAGTQFALGISTNGLLYAWGRNDAGQLGITASTFSWTTINSSGLHTLAIRSDNRVFAWGLNTSGQLGDGTTINRSSPVLVTSGSYTQISAGSSNSYAIRSDGGLFSWGDSSQGQLPLVVQARSSPVQVGTGTVYSSYFNGTTDNLTLSSNAAFAVGTSDFTIECWIYFTVASTNKEIYDTRSPVDTAGLGYDFYLNTSNALNFGTAGSNYIGGSTVLSANTWYHVAVSRVTSGTTALRMFLNGVQEAATSATLANHTNNTPRIGNGANGFFNGFISNLRVVTGQGLYTNTFTPSTSPLTKTTTGSTGAGAAALTGTVVLLTCQNINFIDNSNNSFPIIVIGNPRTDYLQIPFATSTQTYTYDSWSLVSASQTQNYVLATRSDKTLYGWGNNLNGAIGNYSLQSLSNMVVVSPTQVSGGGSWSAISAGGGHSLGIKTDYKLYVWGNNTGGQTAQAGTTFSWTQIAVGQNHSVAIRSDGLLFAWGNNPQGQLGLGDTISRSSPVQVGASSWSQIASGTSHTIAIRSDSTLWAWGLNNAGQLGDSTTITKSSPVQVGSATTWTKVSAGNSQSFAINTGFALYAWGFNVTWGVLGIGDAVNRSSPVQVTTPVVSWSQVATGTSFSGGIAVDGKLYTWGHNQSGQLGGAGNGSTLGSSGAGANRSSPSQVGADTWSYLGVGINAMVGVKLSPSPGTMWSWGSNAQGEFGDNSATTINRSTPVQIGAATNWSVVNGSFAGTMYAINTSNVLYAWGQGGNGQLGDATIVTKSSMVTVAGGGAYTKAVPGSHGMAITTTSFGLQTWGLNTSGELGDSTVVQKSSPIAVGTSIPTILSAPAIIGSSSWTAVSAGGSHSMAITTLGALFAWGSNSNGQLGTTAVAATGDPTTTNRSSPQQVGSSSWTTVSAGGNHTLASRYGDNQLFTWGLNTQGQLGSGVTTARSSPVQINAYSSTTTSALNFNGTTQYLSGGTNLPMITSGQFTIEAWVNWNGTGTSPAVCGNDNWSGGNNAGFYLFLNSTGTISLGAHSGAYNTQPIVYTSTNTVPASTWTHIAMSRDSSNDVRTFINGVVDPTVTNISQSLNLQSGTTPTFHIGAVVRDGGIQQAFPGLISNLRIVPRVAVYTTTFTPPTTALSATQSAGTNIAAITGIPSNGYSVWFNGGQSLNTAGAPRFAAGTGDFTIEFWVFSCGTGRQDWLNIVNTGNFNRINVYYTGTSIAYDSGTSSAASTRISYTISTASLNNAWHHIALSRVSGSSRLYYDGNQVGSTFADTLNFSDTSMAFWLGKDPAGSTFMTGHISNARVIIGGTGLYSGTTLTIPTTSLTNITNTQMLTCQATTIIDGSTTPLTLTNTGTAIVSKAYSPFGTQATILAAQGAAVTSDNSINGYTFTNVATVTQSSVTPFIVALTGTSSSAGASGSSTIASGYVYTWGLNTSGQLGLSDVANRSNAVQVGTLTSTMEYSPMQVGSSSWVSVSAGSSHAIALRSDNTVWSWGVNSIGQLGDGTIVTRSSPVQVGTASSTLSNANAYSLTFDGTSKYLTTSAQTSSTYFGTGDFTIETWVNLTSTPTKVSGATYSLAFNGTNQYLTLPTSTTYISASSDYTIEFWCNARSLGSGSAGCMLYTSSGGYPQIVMRLNGPAWEVYYAYALAFATVPTSTIPLNQWHHMALVRISGTVTWYINGTQYATVSSNTVGASDLQIGMYASFYFDGYISNLRIVNGTGVYTSAFTPPTTPLAVITNTVLLTAQNSTIVDNSTNALTITNTGTVTVSNTSTPALYEYASIISVNDNWQWGWDDSASYGFKFMRSISKTDTTTYTGVLNTGIWYHIAVQRVSGTLSTWVNGVNTGFNYTDTTNYTSTNAIYIGRNRHPSKIAYLPGYISNLRIIKGQGLFSTTFTPSTSPLTTTTVGHTGSGAASSFTGTTILLTAQNTSIVDNSTTAFTFTNTGATVYSLNTPFTSTIPFGALFATQISAGGSHSVALTTSNKLYTWGANNLGQLGDGTVIARSNPTQIGYQTLWSSINAGIEQTIAIAPDKSLWMWGNNGSGQLGLNDVTTRSFPTQILSGAAALLTPNKSSPTQIGTNSWSQVSAGNSTSYALSTTNLLYVWGLNTFGQLGTNNTFLRSSPVQISASISYNQIAAGGTHLTLISYNSPQSILATGLGTSGQLGDQTIVTKSYPVSTAASGYAFNSPVQVAVPTGDYSSYYNSSPVQVGSSSWTAVSAGATHTIGIKYDNTLWSWGKNTNGQLADSTTINRSSPVQVGISSWSQVSAGDSHNLILDSNGILSAFGYNYSGQLGDNS
jgi:alpha-tubulin suppressor-like RCC1 family protein